jgi:hypothetical protein
MNGVLIPFVVSLSNHERNQLIRRFLNNPEEIYHESKRT